LLPHFHCALHPHTESVDYEQASQTFCLLVGAARRCAPGPIGIGGFSGSETVTTFNNLNLPFSNNGALVLNGNTVTTDTGSYRYTQPNGFDADCNGECIGNDHRSRLV
jgi:hypothetical protein